MGLAYRVIGTTMMAYQNTDIDKGTTMAKWQCKIDISNAWKLSQDRLILPDEMATILAKKLESVRQLGNEDDDIEIEKAAIIEELKDFSENFRLAKNNISPKDIEEWWDEFDILMSCAYDWADTPLPNDLFDNLTGQLEIKKACWIKTF